MTWSFVRMMPRGSIRTPEPSDWDLRARESKPEKNSSKNDGRRRTICSAAMLTTEGETFSTTSTTSLRREGSGTARAGRGTGRDRGGGVGLCTAALTRRPQPHISPECGCWRSPPPPGEGQGEGRLSPGKGCLGTCAPLAPTLSRRERG